jgi:type IV fimbrial biogenesis protein FimT
VAPRRPLKRRAAAARGLTLVELLVTIAIFAILVAIAAPNMSPFFVNNRLSGTANEFAAVLTMARGEATLRGVAVTLRRTSTTPRDWGGGWELFVDVDGNMVRDVSPGSAETLLRAGQPLAAPLSLYSSAAVADAIRFLPNGRLRPGASGAALFVFCHDGVIAADGRSRSRAILLSDSGRIRLAATNAAGYPVNDSDVAVISCTDPS